MGISSLGLGRRVQGDTQRCELNDVLLRFNIAQLPLYIMSKP